MVEDRHVSATPLHCIPWTTLIPDTKSRRVLWLYFSAIVEAGGENIGVPKPFLHLGDVGFMREGIGGGRRPHRIHSQSVDLNIQAGRLPCISNGFYYV